MATLTTSAGELHYRITGPDHPTAPPVVFVHGFLVDSTLWDRVAAELATAGVRSYLVDWPLGSHRTPMDDGADLSPTGIAALIDEVLGLLGLDGVTLVGNDSGGALCQLLVARGSTRVGRLVLTNCDAFEHFPPTMFVPLFAAAKHPWLTAALVGPMRWAAMRHAPTAYGMLLRPPRDSALTAAWVEPARTDTRIRRDIARFARGVDRRSLVHAEPALRSFDRPVRIVWGMADRSFKPELARRLADTFPNATLTEVAGVSTFVPVDAPQAVADAIVGIAQPAVA